MLSLALVLSLQGQARDRGALVDLGGKRSGFGLPWKCPDNCRPHGSLDYEPFEAWIFPAGSASIRYSIAATPGHRFFLSRQSKNEAAEYPKIDWIIEIDPDGKRITDGTLRGLLSKLNGWTVKGKVKTTILAELDKEGGFAVYLKHYSGKPYWFYPHDYEDPDSILAFDAQDGTWPWSKTPYPITSEELAYLKGQIK